MLTAHAPPHKCSARLQAPARTQVNQSVQNLLPNISMLSAGLRAQLMSASRLTTSRLWSWTSTSAPTMHGDAKPSQLSTLCNCSRNATSAAVYEKSIELERLQHILCRPRQNGSSRGIHHQPQGGQPQTAAVADSAAPWQRAPVVVGGRTGRAYELLERVSELPRDQRFRQIYRRSTSAVGGMSSPLHATYGDGTLSDRLTQAAGIAGDGESRSSALAGSLLPTDAHRSGGAREFRGITPPPLTRLAVLRLSVATAITQLWPWGRGPQTSPGSAATCPADLHGDGRAGRQIALVHTELLQVRAPCASRSAQGGCWLWSWSAGRL